jgi:hypothetical protein
MSWRPAGGKPGPSAKGARRRIGGRHQPGVGQRRSRSREGRGGGVSTCSADRSPGARHPDERVRLGSDPCFGLFGPGDGVPARARRHPRLVRSHRRREGRGAPSRAAPRRGLAELASEQASLASKVRLTARPRHAPRRAARGRAGSRAFAWGVARSRHPHLGSTAGVSIIHIIRRTIWQIQARIERFRASRSPGSCPARPSHRVLQVCPSWRSARVRPSTGLPTSGARRARRVQWAARRRGQTSTARRSLPLRPRRAAPLAPPADLVRPLPPCRTCVPPCRACASVLDMSLAPLLLGLLVAASIGGHLRRPKARAGPRPHHRGACG